MEKLLNDGLDSAFLENGFVAASTIHEESKSGTSMEREGKSNDNVDDDGSKDGGGKKSSNVETNADEPHEDENKAKDEEILKDLKMEEGKFAAKLAKIRGEVDSRKRRIEALEREILGFERGKAHIEGKLSKARRLRSIVEDSLSL